MKRGISKFVSEDINENKGLLWAWQNQPPLMYWWFAMSSISLCSIYAVLLTHL